MGNPVYYAGINPNNLSKIPGIVSSNAFIDFTKDCIDLDKLTIVWTHDINNQGESTPGQFQSKKTTTDNIIFNGAAYKYIKEWLIDDVAAPLNRIEVQINDTSCGNFTNFSIKSTDLQWCENSICEFDVSLKQKDPLWACIEKTVISDNWMGWFQEHPKNQDGTDKFHPRFSYCVEQRPNGMTVGVFYMLTVFYPVMLMVGAIYSILGAVYGSIASIIAFIGGGSGISFPNPFAIFNDVINAYHEVYIETVGCGREHPAPLIRDYIYNVCAKCGIQVTAKSAPLFFAPKMDFDTSSRGLLTNQDNPYFNACYLFPQAKRGYRRAHDSDSFFIEANAPEDSLDIFLNKLNGLFNSAWTIAKDPRTGLSTLYIRRKDWYKNEMPLYDFSIGGADRDLLLAGGICFTWNEIKLPAYATGIYAADALDSCGNEVSGVKGTGQMNGIANFGITDNNPNYEGSLDKTSQLGGTKFRYDGASTDYIYDAIQFVARYQIINTLFFVGAKIGSAILGTVTAALNQYASYALLMKDEICSLPKILIWDGESYLNAHCVRDIVPINNSLVPTSPLPIINTKYPVLLPGNILTTQSWSTKHGIANEVLGSVIAAPAGIYQVTDDFGSIIDHAAARLVNYDMYFEPCYENTLWDRFHWIDDPRYNPTTRLEWTCNIEACCEEYRHLQLLGDGTGVRLLERVTLPYPYYPNGVLKQVTLTYDSGNELGKHINLKGTA